MSIMEYLKISPDTKVYRYTSLRKFECLMEQSALHFTRLDKFEDPFEGLITESQFGGFKNNNYVMARGEENAKDFIHYGRPYMVLSCWSSASESIPMWNCYAKNGILIESSIAALKESIDYRKSKLDGTPHIADVRYRDYSKSIDDWPDDNANIKVGLAFYKGRAYEDEKEVRIVLKRKVPKGNITLEEWKAKSYPDGGVEMTVDLSKVIKKIVVYPFASHWLVPAVEGILRKHKRQEMIKLVEKSSLEKEFGNVISFSRRSKNNVQ